MAWISKPSSTTQIEKRDKPYLTPELIKTIQETYLPRYEVAQGALMPALHLVQHAYGWVPEQAMLEIAELLEIPPSAVIDTASFYEEYWKHPKGCHVVGVCRSIACEFCGQGEITQAARDKLGIDVSQTTDDNAFTLIEMECLGACGGAPAILIDETLHEHVKPEDVADLIDNAGKKTADH